MSGTLSIPLGLKRRPFGPLSLGLPGVFAPSWSAGTKPVDRPLAAGDPAGPPAPPPSAGRAGHGSTNQEVIVSRTARIVLAGVLTTGALVVGGVALAANPAPAGPSTVQVEQGGPASLRPAQNTPDTDCPYEGGDTGAANASAIRL
jgi:hypothetical protein